MEAATKPEVEGTPERGASSFAKSLFLGEIHEEMVFPWPEPDPEEQTRIRELNADPTVDGVIVQMPLPPTIRLRSVIDAIDPAKDIDGIHPLNAGLLRLGYDGFLPATAHAAVEILRRSAIEIAGQDAVVIGRSAVVGMPAAFLVAHLGGQPSTLL